MVEGKCGSETWENPNSTNQQHQGLTKHTVYLSKFNQFADSLLEPSISQSCCFLATCRSLASQQKIIGQESLGGGFRYPKLGVIIELDVQIFQMGWFNHQLLAGFWEEKSLKEPTSLMGTKNWTSFSDGPIKSAK